MIYKWTNTKYVKAKLLTVCNVQLQPISNKTKVITKTKFKRF